MPGRKSKQASSGHLPLTNAERSKYSKPYGTVTARLNSSAQYKFGDCALSLSIAKDTPVVTPSGFIYERSAILEYLLVKTKELNLEKQKYEQQQIRLKQLKQQQLETKQLKIVKEFESSQTSVIGKKHANSNKNNRSARDEYDESSGTNKKRQKANNDAAAKEEEDEKNPLKRTSYWLAEFQPQTKKDAIEEIESLPRPLERPSSPNSQQPLRRKDLVELDLIRNTDNQVLCAISEKAIVTQPAIALVPKISKSTDDNNDNSNSPPPPAGAQVVLEQVYNDVVIGKDSNKKDSKRKKEKIICPVTGRKIVKIIKLQRGGSSFASLSNDGTNQNVEAKTYRPSMT